MITVRGANANRNSPSAPPTTIMKAAARRTV